MILAETGCGVGGRGSRLGSRRHHAGGEHGHDQHQVGQDRASEAVGMLQGIVQAAPTNFAATYQLARALAVSDHHLEALDVFTRAAKLLDASPDAWYGLSLSALAL